MDAEPTRADAGRDVREGVSASLPIVAAVVPVAAVFGAIGVGLDLTIVDVTLMSATVYAGASQMVAVDLFGVATPAWAILLSVVAVNFRHILYSAAIARRLAPLSRPVRAVMLFFLVDPQFALAEKRAAAGGRVTLAWYFGLALPLYAVWVGGSLVGAVFGKLIENPERWALDMILPVYFLALVMSFRARPGWAPIVAVSGTVAVLVYLAPSVGLTALGPPWHVSLGALAGIVSAAIWPPKRPGTPVEDGRT